MGDPLSRLAYTAAALSWKGAGHHQPPASHQRRQHHQQHEQHDHNNDQPQASQQPAGAASEDTPSDPEDALLADADAADGGYSDGDLSMEHQDLGGAGVAGAPFGLAGGHQHYRQTALARSGSDGVRDLAATVVAGRGGGSGGGGHGGRSGGRGSAGGDGASDRRRRRDSGDGASDRRRRRDSGDGASDRRRRRDSGDGDGSYSPCREAGEEGSQGGAGRATSGGGAKRPGSRRPVQFWGIFNGRLRGFKDGGCTIGLAIQRLRILEKKYRRGMISRSDDDWLKGGAVSAWHGNSKRPTVCVTASGWLAGRSNLTGQPSQHRPSVP
jgi:hypothetical protein